MNGISFSNQRSEFLILILVIIVIWLWISRKCNIMCNNSANENFSPFYGDPGNCSNDLHPDFAVYGATPWSVVPPSWIGRLDQGNGLIGDDVLSGYSFSPAI